MTEKELISCLQSLKQIKPRENWVFFAKNQILNPSTSLGARNNVFDNKMVRSSVLSDVFKVIFQRKLAYVLAAFLLVVSGLFGFMKYDLTNKTADLADVKVTQQSHENLTAIKSSVEDFKTKSRNLSDAVKDKAQNPDLAIRQVQEAAHKLTDALQKNPELAKVIALDVNNNKTYLDIPGGNDASEVNNVYKTIDDQLIKDIEKASLTKDQEDEFTRIKDFYANGGDYSIVLRDILLMNASRDSNK